MTIEHPTGTACCFAPGSCCAEAETLRKTAQSQTDHIYNLTIEHHHLQSDNANALAASYHRCKLLVEALGLSWNETFSFGEYSLLIEQVKNNRLELERARFPGLNGPFVPAESLSENPDGTDEQIERKIEAKWLNLRIDSLIKRHESLLASHRRSQTLNALFFSVLCVVFSIHCALEVLRRHGY